MISLNTNNTYSSLCEVLLNAQIPEKINKSNSKESRKEEIQKIIHFIVTNPRKMDHENHFQRLFTLNSSFEDFTADFQKKKNKILDQAKIFHLKIQKSKYKKLIKSEEFVKDKKDYQLNLGRIQNITIALIEAINSIPEINVFEDIINCRVQIGMNGILSSSYGQQLQANSKANQFYQDVAKNIFIEEKNLYKTYFQWLATHKENKLSSNNQRHSYELCFQQTLSHESVDPLDYKCINKIATIIRQQCSSKACHLGLGEYRSPSISRGMSKMKLHSSQRPLDKGDVVMYVKDEKTHTFYGRILEINGNRVHLRPYDNGKEIILSVEEIIKPF